MLALGSICLLAAAGGHLASPRQPLPAAEMPAAVGALRGATDAAVIPARVADEVRAASHGAPLRLLFFAAILAVVIGLPAVLRRRTSSAERAHQPLRARRHAIALRAPPLRFA